MAGEDMPDIKSSFGLGGRSGAAITNIKEDLLSLATLIESTLLPKIDRMAASLSNVAKEFSASIDSTKKNSLLIADKYGRVTGTSGGGEAQSSRVAPDGKFTDTSTGKPKDTEEEKSSEKKSSDNRVGSGGTFAQVVSGAAFAYNALNGMLPGVPASVATDYATSRSAFFGLGGYGGNFKDQTQAVRDLQKRMANFGTATNSEDTIKAVLAMRQSGLSGFKNTSQIAMGAAAISNLEPGMGVEQAMQLQGLANRPMTVNMMRLLGINVRDAQGNFLPLPQIIDQVWMYLQRTGHASALNEKDIQFSLSPGYGLYNLLSAITSGNEQLIQVIGDGLIMKARAKGASVASLTRNEMKKLGGTTGTINAIANKTAAQTSLLTDTASATSAGYAASQQLAAALNNAANWANPLTKALGYLNGLMTGVLAIGGGIIGNLLMMKGIGSLMGGGEAAAGGGMLKGLKKFGGNLLKGVGGLFKKGFKFLKGALGKTVVAAEEGDALAFEAAILEDIAAGAIMLGTGGPSHKSHPYIVGEKGPELFVPKTDGVVVPANLTSSLRRAGGGGVKAGGAAASPTTGADIVSFLMSKGYSQAGAEGVVGNLTWESGLNTQALGDKGTSYGLAQWHGGRWDALKKFSAAHKLDPSSAAAQEQFLVQELNQKQYKGLVSELKSPNISKFQAAADFMRDFERPADQSSAAALKRANAYKGKLGISSMPTGADSSGGTTAPIDSYAGTFSAQEQARAANLWNMMNGSNPSSSNNHNYGGVTVNINAGSQTPDQLMKTLQDLFHGHGIVTKIAG